MVYKGRKIPIMLVGVRDLHQDRQVSTEEGEGMAEFADYFMEWIKGISHSSPEAIITYFVQNLLNLSEESSVYLNAT